MNIIDKFILDPITSRIRGITRGGVGTSLPDYQEATLTTTFAGNGGGTASSNITIRIVRVGRLVTLDVPEITSVLAPAGGSIVLQNATALPTWARPTQANPNFVTNSYNNGAYVNTTLGRLEVTNAGNLNFYRDRVNTAYTNGAVAGFGRQVFSYYI